MVEKSGRYQVSFNAGELAPEIYGNTGLKQFYAGAKAMRNAEPVPQGGFDLLPRSAYCGKVRRGLATVYSAPATTSASIAAPGIAMTFNFGSTLDVSALDLGNFSGTLAIAIRAVQVEAFDVDLGAWVNFGGLLTLATLASSRRVALPPGQSMRCNSVRLRLYYVAGSMQVTVTLTAYSEVASGIPKIQRFAFTVSRADAYLGIMVGGHMDFWKDGVYVGCVGVPYASDDLDQLRGPQRAESLFLFHQNHPTCQILRHGVDWDWSLSVPSYTQIPDVNYGGAYFNTPELWLVYLRWPSSGFNPVGQTMILSINGEETEAIGITGTGSTPDWTAVAGATQTAVLNLTGVDVGATVTVSGIPGVGYAALLLTFDGANNAGQHFDTTGRILYAAEMGLTTSRYRKGKMGGEPVFSVARGYAGCGAFYQDRLIQGGFKAKPGAFMASRTGEYFDLNIELGNAAAAMLINIDMDGSETIIAIARARHLVIMTTEAGYYIADRAITATNPPNVIKSDKYGVSPRVPVIEQENSLLYISPTETIVYAATYNDVLQAYESQPISLLCSHLISGICDATLQGASLATDSQRYFLTRDDGLLVTGLLIRNQDVTGFVRWETDGQVRRCCVDGAQRVYVMVERLVDGVATLCVEILRDDLYLDCAVSQVLPAPQTLIEGLDIHEGATVWAKCDGYYEGPFTVSGGTITLPYASTNVTVGRWTPPLVEDLPIVRDVAPHIVLKRPARVHTVQMDLIGTTSIALGANGLAAVDYPLSRAGDPADQPCPPFTGELVARGLQGFSAEGTIVITQKKPGPLQVRNITKQAKV